MGESPKCSFEVATSTVYSLHILSRGDIQFISRLVRLVKHFVPSTIFDPSDVSMEQQYNSFVTCYTKCMYPCNEHYLGAACRV